MDAPDWSGLPHTPGVHVIFDGDEVLYVGMAGRDGKASCDAGGGVMRAGSRWLSAKSGGDAPAIEHRCAASSRPPSM